ncbi:lysophospholipid acyltransferase family protein [Kallotenue papyrolyticum]|uniref:lysophospholipid acyltransferase family protein n=1 Tax=Kallotenue papyrolyticum TaxID=1325125 RepID=UPI000492668A|nr:lysophospholipid acyltransferase family protein [Kallotenue papyrolyticum]
MIRLPARKTSLLEAAIFHALVRPALRRAFHRVALTGPSPASDLPLLIYSNHPSWWDGYIAFLLARAVWRHDGYLMMEEPQLRRYSFFRYCGVFGVDRRQPRQGWQAVRYAAALLDRPARLVWIFPQGVITPNDRRPLVTFSGAAHIACLAAPVRCLPVALRFEFLQEQRPEALVRVGTAHVVVPETSPRALHREMDARLTAELDALREDVLRGATATYATVLNGRASVNVRWDRWRARLLRRPRR